MRPTEALRVQRRAMARFSEVLELQERAMAKRRQHVDEIERIALSLC